MALRVDDDDRSAEAGPATGDAGFAAAGRICGRRSRRRSVEAAARHQQRRLGQPVAWPERRRLETASRERGGESLEGVPPDRFRAVVGVAPTAEIEGGALRRSDPAHAQVVGEVGSAATGRPVPRNGPQPPDRSLQERGRRHQVGRAPAVDGLQDAVDQPHVVDDREPRDRHRRPVVPGPLERVGQVVQQVSVADHHAPRRVGRAGGVLEKRQRVRCRRGVAPDRGAPLVQRFGSYPGCCFGVGCPFASGTPERRRGPGGSLPRPPLGGPARAQHDGRPRVLRDRDGPREVPVGRPPARREDRDRHDPRIQTTEERRDELEARGIHE